MNLNAEQKEDLRAATRSALACRHPAALPLRAVARAVKKEVPFLFEEPDLDSALEVLRGLGQVEFLTAELGSSRHWRATAAGVLAEERQT